MFIVCPGLSWDQSDVYFVNLREETLDAVRTDTGGSATEDEGDVLKVSGEGVAITDGKVTHDGRNIGSTHIHGGVVPGGGLTDMSAN